MSNKRNIKKQIDLNPNKEVSKIIDTTDALEELNKKIPINIDKTLDPANNSIGLYGLEDMEKRNKAVLKATRDTYKSEIKKAEKDIWAKDPIDYVTGIFKDKGKDYVSSKKDLEEVKNDINKIKKIITKEAPKIKNAKSFKSFIESLKDLVAKSSGEKIATKKIPWVVLVDYIIDNATDPKSGLFRLYHYNTKLDTLNKAGSFTNITDSEAYKNTVKARNSSSHGNSKYQGTPYSSNPVEDTNFLKEFYEEMWTKQYPILENDFSKEFETSLPEDIIKKNEILQRYYKAKEQNKFFDQNVDISYTKERFPSFKDLAKVLNLSPTSVHNTRPEPEFTSEIGSDLLAHMPLNVYTSDLSEISTSTSSYPSSSTSGTSTEKKKDKKKKDRKPNLLDKIGDGLNTFNPFTIIRAKKKQALEKRLAVDEERMKEYKAHIQRSIADDPSELPTFCLLISGR